MLCYRLCHVTHVVIRVILYAMTSIICIIRVMLYYVCAYCKYVCPVYYVYIYIYIPIYIYIYMHMSIHIYIYNIVITNSC